MKASSARKLAETQFQLLLRIKHPSLDPEEITRVLQMEPEHSAAAGTSVSTAGKKCFHSESYWLAELPTLSVREMVGLDWLKLGEKHLTTRSPFLALTEEKKSSLAQMSAPLDFQLFKWLKSLETHSAFFKTINDAQGSITLVVQRLDRSAPVTITVVLARRIADLGIRLEID